MAKKKEITPKNKAMRRMKKRMPYTPITMAEKEEIVEISKEAYFARIEKEAGHGQAKGDL